MKVSEMRSLINNLKNEGKLTDQKIEFVMDTKKYFANDVKAGTDTMKIEITRENYHPLTVENFVNGLSLASSDLEITVVNGKSAKGIAETFLTDSALEIVLD